MRISFNLPNSCQTSLYLVPRFVLIGLLGISAGLVFSGCQSEPEKPDGVAQTEPLPPGHEVFLNHCLGCHLGDGNPPGPNTIVTQSEKLKSLETFKAYLRNPDNTNMPPIGQDQVTDEQVDQLYDYLHKLPKP